MKRRLSEETMDKLAQDTTNEIWSVTLRREYKTPGEKKRALKAEILSTIRYVNNPDKVYPNEPSDDDFPFY